MSRLSDEELSDLVRNAIQFFLTGPRRGGKSMIQMIIKETFRARRSEARLLTIAKEMVGVLDSASGCGPEADNFRAILAKAEGRHG